MNYSEVFFLNLAQFFFIQKKLALLDFELFAFDAFKSSLKYKFKK